MKKIFIAAILVVTVGSSAFALDVNKVSYKVKSSFEAQFTGASNVTWSFRETYTKASFTLVDQPVDAYYGTEGELIAFSRKIDFKKLPLNAIQRINKEYAAYQVAESIEFDQDGDKNYYVSLEDGDKKVILEVSLYGAVSVYHGAKK